MATLNRFNQFTKRDYNMEWYAPETFVPNFEAWDSLLGVQQAKYDAAIAATQKYPKHLQNRVDLAGQYKQGAVQAVDDITKTYMDQGLTSGNRKMRDFAMKLNKDWQPGGLAYELEQEYTDYQTAQQTIDKYYKDAKAESSVNKQFSLAQLQKAAQEEFKYNKEGDIYSRANIVADTRPYVDIMDEAQKVVKDIKENGYTDIVKMSPAWFKKIQVEEITPETIKEVTNTLLQQPKYAEQRQLELWAAKRNLTPEALTELETSTKAALQSEFDKTAEELTKLSTTKQGKKDLQEILAKEGYYDGKLDGDFGKDSKAALDNFIKDSKDKLNTRLQDVNADAIINEQLLNNYTKPLVAAYKRRKEEETLIFNQEWGINAKIAAGRKNTQDMITAMQTLKTPEQGQYLVTPGLSRPMETLSNLRTQYTKTLDDSKKAFGTIATASGITGILGTAAPNAIHAATEARLKSASPQEFQANLMSVGIVADATKLWDYYNSPGAENLKNSYLSMQQARQDLEGSVQAQSDIVSNYFATPEGTRELNSIKKQYNLGNVDAQTVANMIMNEDPKLRSEKTGYSAAGSMAGSSFVDMSSAFSGTPNANNVASNILDKVNKAYKNNPEAFPVALRGYAFNAIKGPGSDLEKVIQDDLVSGFTMGYNSDDNSGVNFTKIGSNGKVDINDVNLKEQSVRFNVDAKGITYYVTAKDKDGKPVSTIMRAPDSHKGRLINVALDLKKQAYETGDSQQAALAEQMFSVLNNGPQYNNAVQDAFVPTYNNTKQLNNVIEPKLSEQAGTIRTFGENGNIRGTEIGGKIEANGIVYQKFKVLNPKTGDKSYMLTYQTQDGYVPIENTSGGYYFKTAQEAESPIIHGEMMRRIPVEIDQKKIKQTNLTEEEAQLLMINQRQLDEDLNDNE